MGINGGLDGLEDLGGRLDELGLVGVTLLELVKNSLRIRHGQLLSIGNTKTHSGTVRPKVNKPVSPKRP
jgi:hypothetical protein